MTEDTRLSELLLRWEELQEQGRDVPAEELGRDQPELVDELRRRIRALRALRWVKDVGPPAGTTDGPPAAATTAEDAGAARTPEVLAGRYRLERRIAEGGFGHVWQGLDMVTGRRVAVKIAKPHRVAAPGQLEAFWEEARKAAGLRHPGIVPVHDVGHEAGAPFIVSDLIDGTDLAEWMRCHHPTPAEAARMVAQVARQLQHAHAAGIVHRDMKPANILIDGAGRLFLTDFGIAVTARQLRDRAVDCAGTLAYMAPEQAACDSGRIDARSDVWSLGVLLYELLTGRLPFQGDTVAALREQVLSARPTPPRRWEPGIPAALERVCLRCLAKERADRYATASDLADELEAFLGPAAGAET